MCSCGLNKKSVSRYKIISSSFHFGYIYRYNYTQTGMPHNDNIQITDPENFHPFETIALAFSGGGFRAASYSLGTISYLQQVRWPEDPGTNLLSRTTYMSSASGGTIATSLYALHSTKADTTQDAHFGPYYKTLLKNINGVALLDKVFIILNDINYWKERPHKRRNIINAFALAYDELLFNKSLCSTLDEQGKTNLEEVCFNATEFYRGLLFRQTFKLKKDSEPDPDFVYGNFIINLKRETAAQLKIADLLAASSCFPAGFEPIIFPDDFATGSGDEAAYKLAKGLHVEAQELSKEELELVYDAGALKEAMEKLRKATVPGQPIDPVLLQKALCDLPINKALKFGLMDGGITDNQGFESMIRANERRSDAKDGSGFRPFDFMMVNDVGSHYMDPYQLPRKNTKGWFTINRILILSVLALLLGITGLVCAFGCPAHPVMVKLAGIFGGMLTVAGAAVVFGVFKLRRYIRGSVSSEKGLNLDKNFSPEITNKFFHYFGTVPISILLRMVKERGASMLTLNNDVFLKRIRQLLYKSGFDNPKLKYRLKTNHIYDLAFTNDINRIRNQAGGESPSVAMQLVAQSAFEMGTTLWFDSDQRENFKLADIVACGQFTSCFNLYEYICCLEKATGYEKVPQAYKNRVSKIKEQVKADLGRFKTDPYWLFNELGKKYIDPAGWKNVAPASASLPASFAGLR